MLTIIHGDDLAKSRKLFTDIRQSKPQAEVFDGQDVDITALTQIFEGGGFFSDDKVIFIENFISKRKNTSEYKDLQKYILNQQSNAEIYIWESKELEKATINSFKDSSIRLFKLPQALFNFLDAIKPNDGKQLIKIYHLALENSDPEAIFYMLIRHIRLLLALHPQSNLNKQNEQSDNNEPIDEIKRMQPWQQTKLVKQTKLFKIDKLIYLYKQLYDIEAAQKIGMLPNSLSDAIDIFLLGV